MSRDRFDDELRAVIRRAVPRDAPDRLRDRVLDATKQPTVAASRFSFAWRVAAGVAAAAVVLVAAYAGWELLRGTTPAPASSPSPSGVASASPQPAPFTPAAWELRSLPAPPGHPDFVVHGVSPDGSVVLFGDAGVYDHLYVEHNGQVSEINVPGHESGTPLAARLSPSGAFAVIEDANQLFRYDVAAGQTTAIAGPPGVTAIDTFVFTSENSVAALTGPIITPIGGGPTNTQLWVLNLTTGDWARQGDRRDAVGLLTTDAGPVLVVDTSAAHDSSGWHLYLVQPDGSDSLLYDASGSAYVAVSPDGRHLALSRGELGADGTWLVDLVSGATREVSPGGMVQGFAPDGSQFSVLYQSDGHIEAFDLSGTQTASLASGVTAAWVGVPASSSLEPSPSPTPGCKPIEEPPFYRLVGWVQGRVDLIVQQLSGCDLSFALLSVDPTSGASVRQDLPADIRPDLASTDGSSLAIPLGTGEGIMVISADGTRHQVLRPTGMPDDWNAYGLPPLPGGGYLVSGPTRLLRIAADGSGLTSDALPSGYVAVAPTSDPDRFILASAAEMQRPYSLSRSAPFTTWLWTRGSGQLTKIADNTKEVLPATDGLAHLLIGAVPAEGGTWENLGVDGHLTRRIDDPGFVGALSPDSTWLVTAVNIGTGGNDAYQVSLIRVADDKTIATFPGQGGSADWQEGRAVILMQSQLPRTTTPSLVIVDATGAYHSIPLP